MPTAERITSDFGFHVEYSDESGHRMDYVRLRPADFGHAIRHTLFTAFRHGLCEAYQPLAEGARITPLFPESEHCSSRATGFRVSVPLTEGSEQICDFEISYFTSAANRLRAELLRRTLMADEQKLFYQLHALLDDEQSEQPVKKLPLKLEPATDRIAIDNGTRGDFGTTDTWDEPLPSEVPVLVDQRVLEDIVEEAKADPEHEIGGFLLGRVLRDNQSGEVFIASTGVASARDTTESSGTSVTFTPASFSQARKLAQLRGARETICGWYHSHPFKFCAECPYPTPNECIAKVLFYSQDDVHLMETTFEQPYMVGLLAAIEPRIEQAIGHLPVRMYGWRHGTIRQRGFEVIRSSGG